MLPTWKGSNLQPPDHQSEWASNWTIAIFRFGANGDIHEKLRTDDKKSFMD